MTQTYTLVLTGTITALTPIATCPPRPESEKRSDLREKNPPSRLPRMTVGNAETVYFPGSGIRGKLRRAALKRIRDAIQGDGEPIFTLNDHYFNVIGGIKGKGGDSKINIAASTALRESNPLVSLFGSMASHMAGRLMIGHAVPKEATAPDVVTGVRTDDVERSPEVLHFLSEEEREKWLTQSQEGASNSKAKADLKTVEASLRKLTKQAKDSEDAAAELERLTATREELKATVEEAAVNVKQVLAGYETIPQGTVMSHRIVLRNATKLEIGLLMETLREFALDPIIGAHSARGCGVVEAKWNARVRVDDNFVDAGSITVSAFDGATFNKPSDGGEEILLESLAAWMGADLSTFNFRAPQ